MRPLLYERLEHDLVEARHARLALERRHSDLAEMRREFVGLQLDLAIIRLRCALARKYRPDQPRVPAGNPDGGRWALEQGRPSGRTRVDDTSTIRVAAEITGFTKHGINRAIQYGIGPAAILDAVTNPVKVRPRPNGSTQYRGREATVVLDPEGVVITMWPQ